MHTVTVDHIAADLCVRYPQVPCERIEAMVETTHERHLLIRRLAPPRPVDRLGR